MTKPEPDDTIKSTDDLRKILDDNAWKELLRILKDAREMTKQKPELKSSLMWTADYNMKQKPELKSSLKDEIMLISALLQALDENWYHHVTGIDTANLQMLQDELFAFLVAKVKERI